MCPDDSDDESLKEESKSLEKLAVALGGKERKKKILCSFICDTFMHHVYVFASFSRHYNGHLHMTDGLWPLWHATKFPSPPP